MNQLIPPVKAHFTALSSALALLSTALIGFVGAATAVAVPAEQPGTAAPVYLADAMAARAKQVLGNRFIDLWLTSDNTRYAVAVAQLANSEKASLASEISEGLAPVDLVSRSVTRNQLDTLAVVVDKAVGGQAVVSVRYDAGVLVVFSPPADTAALTAAIAKATGQTPLTGAAATKFSGVPGAATSSQAAIAVVPLEIKATEGQEAAPLRAGKKLVTPTGACTSAFLVQKASGQRFSLTAGHCGDNGGSISLGGVGVGQISDDKYPNTGSQTRVPVDAALFGPVPANAQPSIFINSSFNRPVIGSVDPTPGMRVCTRGAVRQVEYCGQVTLINYAAPYAGKTITVEHFIYVTWNNGAPGVQPGDSGSPLYMVNEANEAIAVGILGGGSGSFAVYSPVNLAMQVTGTSLVTSPSTLALSGSPFVSLVQPQPQSVVGNAFSIRTHVQDFGWIPAQGTTGGGLQLEAIEVTQLMDDVEICLRPHLAEEGWKAQQCTNRSGNAVTVGTVGQGRAVEALEITVKGLRIGSAAVRAHVRNVGWQTWQTITRGATIQIGTTGRSLPIEAFDLRLTEDPKYWEQKYPGLIKLNTGNESSSPTAFKIESHLQDYGWLATTGTTGEVRRLEAIKVTQLRSDAVICLRAHVSDQGWEPGLTCTQGVNTSITVGTTGKSRAIEALQISIRGAGVQDFKVAAHVSNVGWQSDQSANSGATLTIGTTGRSLAMEAFRLSLRG
ncbi:MAG: hypothetical protein LBI84_03265 [Propionibacteriaceae bacterium]|nr:hypothetical protein [Propionibacteriaceae bacterium]